MVFHVSAPKKKADPRNLILQLELNSLLRCNVKNFIITIDTSLRILFSPGQLALLWGNYLGCACSLLHVKLTYYGVRR